MIQGSHNIDSTNPVLITLDVLKWTMDSPDTNEAWVNRRKEWPHCGRYLLMEQAVADKMKLCKLLDAPGTDFVRIYCRGKTISAAFQSFLRTQVYPNQSFSQFKKKIFSIFADNIQFLAQGSSG